MEQPHYIIETKRLGLRELTAADGAALSLVLSDAQSMQFYPHPFSPAEVSRWIQWNISNYAQYGFGLWAVVLKAENELIGDCGITMQHVENEVFPEIGYHIRRDYCCKGFATEAAQAVLNYAYTNRGFSTVISYMKSANRPSRRIAEKIGMNYVKTFQKTVFGEQVADEVLYMIQK